MTGGVVVLLGVLIWPAPVVQAAAAEGEAPAPGVIAVVQVHGNNATREDEILAIAGIAVGERLEPDSLESVRRRLLDSGRFEGVEVRRRFASIADPSQIAVVIIVDEFPVRVVLSSPPEGQDGAEPTPRVVRRGWLGSAMILPILDGEDGYGLTYGARIAYPDLIGSRSRVSLPLTWGGHKRAGLELERLVAWGPLSRVLAGVSIERRRNPAFDRQDTRRRLWLRVERAAGVLRGGVTAGWQGVSFEGAEDRFRSIGGDIVFDTRIDPGLPRNAVYLRTAWTRFDREAGGGFDQYQVDARGYLGLVGQSVVVARVERESANRPVPRAFKPLLGGWSSLRGFAAGAWAGDTRVAGALELRVPVTSVLSTASTGVTVFVDAGKSYDDGVRFQDAVLRVGTGLGVWVVGPLFHAGVSVAHGRGSGTRANLGVGLTF